jgi:hypothetical protein
MQFELINWKENVNFRLHYKIVVFLRIKSEKNNNKKQKKDKRFCKFWKMLLKKIKFQHYSINGVP